MNETIKYETGIWYRWDGGECPVHPETEVRVKWSCNGVVTFCSPAKRFHHWEGKEICAFKIVREYVGPSTQ